MPEHITTAGNTLVPMVLALRSLGFRVARTARSGEDEWIAESDELRLSAGELPSLLALALMRQVRGTNWMATDAEIDAVLSEFGGI